MSTIRMTAARRTNSCAGTLNRCGVLLAIAAVVATQIASLHAQQREDAADPEIASLIAKLSSPNRAPTERSGPELRYPTGYSRKKQDVVKDARWQLTAKGLRAFRQLIAQWENNHYSLTYTNGISGYMRNATVGEVCRIIVYDQIQPYGFWPLAGDDPRGKPKRPGYPSEFLRDAKSAREWLERYKDKSLYDLQLMALEWVIAEEAKRPEDFTDEEREELSRLRSTLIETKTPMRRGNYYRDDYD